MQDHPVWLEFSRDAMACRFEVLLHPGKPENGGDAALQALDTISFLEQLLSVYIPGSEFSLLNARAATHEIPVSESTFELLKLGLAIHQKTKGAFDLTAAKLSKTWGFYRRQGKMPTESEITEALQTIGSNHIELNHQLRTVRFTKPIEINSGGIGKGFALDCAAQSLHRHGVVDFAFHGGKSSILCAGSQSLSDTSLGWQIAVRHPEQSDRVLGILSLHNQALGTSGPANQFFYFKGKRYGHIIDPRTGWPADGMLSITVLHRSAGVADALATGLFVLGIDEAIKFCEQDPEVRMLAILRGERDGQCEVVTCNIQEGHWCPSK